MENAGNSLRVGVAGYCVNRKHIVIGKPTQDNITDITETAIAAGKILKGRNIALYGMAALVDDEENPGQQKFASHATLINEGIIEIHFSELVKAYRDQVKKNTDDESRTYRFIKCFAMAAGKDSTIINNGTIRIYFDHDMDSDIPVYGETLVAGENSFIQNNGTIELLGNGSFATQVRAIAIPANNVTIQNHGNIRIHVGRAATVRVLATTGNGGTIANYGNIDINSTGRIMTIARFANTHLLNAGTVNITSRATFIENKVSFLFQSYPLACAFYEHSLPNTNPVPPIVNQGTVKIHLQGSEASTPHAVAFGIYSEMVGNEQHIHRMENSGSISVSKSGPYDFLVAEVGCNVQSAKNFPYAVEIGEWRTTSRDFAKTKDLFVCNSGRFNFEHTRLTLDGEAMTPKAEDLVWQREEAQQRGDTFVMSNTDKMQVEQTHWH